MSGVGAATDTATDTAPGGTELSAPQPTTTFVNPSTTLTVVLPSVAPQSQATARDEGGTASAQVVNGCVPTGSCREIDAPLVAFPGGHLSGIDFAHASLTGADFRDADLSGVDMTGANLSGADLSGANLNGAVLAGANLRGVFMRGSTLLATDLRGADLFDAIVDGSDFTKAVFCDTTWVDGRELDGSC